MWWLGEETTKSGRTCGGTGGKKTFPVFLYSLKIALWAEKNIKLW